MRIVCVDAGSHVVVNDQGGWVYALRLEGKDQWAAFRMDSFGNAHRRMGTYRSLEEARQALNV